MSIIFTYFRYYEKCNIKIKSQFKILIVREEGWFGQPKYSTPTKNPSTLCRLLYQFGLLQRYSKVPLNFVRRWTNFGLDKKCNCTWFLVTMTNFHFFDPWKIVRLGQGPPWIRPINLLVSAWVAFPPDWEKGKFDPLFKVATYSFNSICSEDEELKMSYWFHLWV